MGLIFQWKETAKYAGAVLIGAAIFSMFHFVGDYGDEYSFNLFMIRMIAGVFLGIVYAMRGFGVAAYTHAIYDLVVLTLTTTNESMT